MVKSKEKKCQKYFRVTTITTNDLGKCRRNVNFAETDTEHSTGKNDFDYCEGYLSSILRQNIIMAVLRKAHSHSVVICR